MRIVGIVQARFESTRLPGKVLADIHGRPMLGWVIERARRAGCLDDLWIATSTSTADDPVAAFAEQSGAGVYRGDVADVLGRYIGAADAARADVVVRLTGDTPVLEPAYLRMTIDRHLAGDADLTCAKHPEDIIPGTGCEAVNLSALRVAAQEGHSPDDREHVTWYLLTHRDQFNVEFVRPPMARKNPGIRMTVDEPADLDLVRQLYARLAPDNPDFGVEDIFALFDREPAVFDRNRDVQSRSKLLSVPGQAGR